ncbi:hypothetical protein AB0J83_03195 [Actinoplanes sp. NPDC049596]|uniref:hypothetical protein n=1 Tax=unclassified Actinoplanes TaxID=2626549 RepID=UPI0034323430
MLEKAVELGKVNLAEDDPDVLLTAAELGTILQRADDPMAARRVLEDAYASGLWRLGDSDPLMLRISHDIGVVAEELGNRHEARKAFTRVAELGPGVLGDGHPAVARARGYLGPGAAVRGDAGADFVRTEVTPPPGPQEEPTTVLPPVVEERERSAVVQPPSPANQRVWVGPEDEQARAGAVGQRPRIPSQGRGPLDEPTIAQPIINPPAYPSASVSGGHPQAYSGPPAAPGFDGPGEAASYPQALSYPGAVTPGGGADSASPAYSRKGLGLFAAIAAVLAAVIAVAALVFVLANRTGDAGRDPDVPTLGGPAPSDVRLKDGGTAITVTWTDPSSGSVSFMVTMGRPGQELKPVSTLGPGQTSFEMSGLNGTLNYCFAVVAVYRNNQFATSPQACTSRATATPR